MEKGGQLKSDDLGLVWKGYWHNRQVMTTPIKIKTYATQWALGPIPAAGSL